MAGVGGRASCSPVPPVLVGVVPRVHGLRIFYWVIESVQSRRVRFGYLVARRMALAIASIECRQCHHASWHCVARCWLRARDENSGISRVGATLSGAHHDASTSVTLVTRLPTAIVSWWRQPVHGRS